MQECPFSLVLFLELGRKAHPSSSRPLLISDGRPGGRFAGCEDGYGDLPVWSSRRVRNDSARDYSDFVWVCPGWYPDFQCFGYPSWGRESFCVGADFLRWMVFSHPVLPHFYFPKGSGWLAAAVQPPEFPYYLVLQAGCYSNCGTGNAVAARFFFRNGNSVVKVCVESESGLEPKSRRNSARSRF